MLLQSLLSTAVRADENGAIHDRVLLSASELDYPPFAIVREGNVADGFSVDILKAVCRVMGLRVQISVGPWNEIKQQLIDGQLDVLPLVAYSEEREEFFDFSTSYLKMHDTVFVRKGDKRIAGLADLKGKEIIVMRGDSAHEFALREKISDHLILTDSFGEAMRMLAAGKHDAVIVQKLVGLQLIKQLGITNLKTVPALDHKVEELSPLHRAPRKTYGQEYCLAVKKGDAELLRHLNEGLAIIVADGTYDELYDKWFGPILPHQVKPQEVVRFLVMVVAPLLLLLAVLGLWFLRREVGRKTIHLKSEIAQRIRTEQSLQGSLQSLDMAQQVAQVGSWDWKIQDNKLNWSNETYRQFGMRPQECEPDYELFEQFIHPKDREAVNLAVKKALQDDVTYSIEARMFRRGGTEWLMHAQGTVYRDKQGTAIRFIGTQQDITAHKQAEEWLRLQGEIIANMSEGVYLVSAADGTIVFTNEKFDRMFGYDLGELKGQHVSIVNAPGDKGPRKTADEIMAVLQETGTWQGEIKTIRKNGTPFWSWAGVSTFEHWKLGTVFIGIHSDITEKKLTEVALRKSEEKNRRILRGSIDGFFMNDQQGRFLDANEAYCRLVGYSLGELRKLTIPDVEAVESSKDVAAHMIKTIETGHDRFETKHFHKDGHTIDLELSVNFDRELGEIFFSFARDITERKQAEANLQASEERYRLLAENSAEAIWQFSPDGTIDFINAAGAAMYGYEQNETTNLHFSALLTEKWLARGEEVVNQALGGQVVRDEIYVKHKKGHEFPISLTLTPIRKEGKIIGGTGIARDITEKIREEEEELRKSLAEKESLLKEIHHRVKNNMQIVSSLLFLQGQNTDNPEVHAVIQDSQNRVKTMGLIHEKLYQTKNLARIDFDDYLRTLTRYLADTFNRATCRVEIAIRAEDIFLPVDTAIPCGLIINELVTNSLKYASTDGCPTKIDVSIVRRTDNRLSLTVSDSGPGLPADFNPDSPRTLGLSLVRNLAKQLGATLEFRNENGLACELIFAADPQP